MRPQTRMLIALLLFFAALAAFMMAGQAHGDEGTVQPVATVSSSPDPSTTPDASPSPSASPTPTYTLISSSTPQHYQKAVIAAPEATPAPDPSATPDATPVPRVGVIMLHLNIRLYCTYDQSGGYTVTMPVDVPYSDNPKCPATEPK